MSSCWVFFFFLTPLDGKTIKAFSGVLKGASICYGGVADGKLTWTLAGPEVVSFMHSHCVGL